MTAWHPDRVDSLLRLRGVSVREIAEATGVTVRTARRWLSGEYAPKRAVIRTLALRLNVAESTLTGSPTEALKPKGV